MKKALLISILSMIVGILVGVIGTTIFVKKIAKGKSLAAQALGYDNLEKERFTDAIAFFNQGLAFSPNSYQFHLGLGQAYEGLGLTDIALREYKIASELTDEKDPIEEVDKVLLLSKLGDIYLEKGDSEDAVTAYKKALTLKPEWPDPYRGLGIANHRMGDIEKAKQNLREYLRLETREKRAEEKKAAEELLRQLEKR